MADPLPLDEAGNWQELLRPAEGRRPRPALFLDRDGVLVEDVGYLSLPQDLKLLPGAGETLAAARRAGLFTVLLTNQSGVGRGLYSWEDFQAVQAALRQALAAAGAPSDGGLDLVLACPHHPNARPPYRLADPPCRKPNPGLLLAAAGLLPIALARSFMVGDRVRDLEAASRAGLAGGLLLLSDSPASAAERKEAESLARPDFAVGFATSHRELLPLLAELGASAGTGEV